MPYLDKQKQRDFNRDWARRNRASQRKYSQNNRKKILEKLGGKCVYCGCDIPEALEINHINGGGTKEKYFTHRKQFYLDILAGRYDISKLELTCKICNAWHCLVKLKGIEDRWRITFN